MKMLSSLPELVGVYRGEMVTNLLLVRDVSSRATKHVLVMNRTEEIETRSNLKLWSACLHNCTDNGDVKILCADIVRRGNHGDVDIYKAG